MKPLEFLHIAAKRARDLEDLAGTVICAVLSCCKSSYANALTLLALYYKMLKHGAKHIVSAFYSFIEAIL